MGTAAERQRLTRERRRRGVRPFRGEITEAELEFLAKRGYGARPDDPISIGRAVSTFLGDALFEAMGQ